MNQNGNGKAARPLRVLWASNAPWTKTGYGTQTAIGTRALRDLGAEVGVFAFFGMEGAISNADGMVVYPAGILPWGNDVIRGHASQFDADVVVSLMDVWVQDYWGRKLSGDGRLFCPWLPVDHDPAPERIVEKLDKAHQPIAMSKFGKRALDDADVPNVAYVPHAFNNAVFHVGDKMKARQALKLPEDKFIIGMVAANKGFPSRKCYPEQVRAFAKFHETHPDAWLYIHALMEPIEDGINLTALCQSLGLKAGRDFGFVNGYEYIVGWHESRMALLFQSFDILSNASMGEGFGVPILEAQACGTPVVTTAVTSMPELTWGGICVQKTHPWWTPLQSWTGLPDVDELVDAYAALYELLHIPAEAFILRSRARDGAMPYEAERVRDTYWKPLVQGWMAHKRTAESAESAEILQELAA